MNHDIASDINPHGAYAAELDTTFTNLIDFPRDSVGSEVPRGAFLDLGELFGYVEEG